jgi:hypothetical protein
VPFRSFEFPARRALLWLSSSLFLALAIGANHGEYSESAICYLTLAIGCGIGGVFFSSSRVHWLPESRRALDLALGAAVLLFLFIGSARSSMPGLNAIRLLLVCGFVLIALMPATKSYRFRRWLFPAVLCVQAMIWTSFIQSIHRAEQNAREYPTHVRNDVQIFAQEAARALTAGKNPYSLRMPNVMGGDMPFYSEGTTGPDGKLSFGYPYLPLTLLWSLPGYWLGDFRLSHAVALLGAALFLGTARPSPTSQLAATFLTLFPSTLYVLALSWIEPIAIFFLSACVYCYFRAPRWLFLTLGCLIVSKQYTVFMLALLPLLVPEPGQWRSLLWKSLGVALFLTLPMALWDIAGFYRSVIEIQFKQPFREDSLSYLVTVFQVWGSKLSPALGFGALLGGLGLALWKVPRVASLWCSAGAVAYLGFFVFNKQAFANYYYWPFALLVTAVAIALPPTETSP